MAELTPADARRAIALAITTAAPELAEVEEVLGARATPQALMHRRFRVDPGTMVPIGKARPGDVLLVREAFGIVLTHEGAVGQDVDDYAVASADLLLVLRAVLTRIELSGLAQPELVQVTRRRVGHLLEQTVAVTAQYHLALPAAS